LHANLLCVYVYRFSWEWLPGFGGQPLRINKLTSGTGEFSSSIFIGGEFNPPVLVWTVSYNYIHTTIYSVIILLLYNICHEVPARNAMYVVLR
jgi:hypothetical protein